jgi:DNA-binding NtrC family response regulator
MIETHALIVEDLVCWQDALNEALTDAGYHVCLAASYAEAMDVLGRRHFHLAIIDPVLDDANRRNRDGLRVLQHILAQLPDICSVVVTSSDPNRIRHEVNELSPAIPVLWKDEWDDGRFLAVVRELLNRRAGSG